MIQIHRVNNAIKVYFTGFHEPDSIFELAQSVAKSTTDR